MTSLDRLRLAVVLTHPVGGARLLLHCPGGKVVVAGSHPSADLSLCELRRVVLASSRPEGPDWTRLVEAVDVAGCLEDLGAGIYRLHPERDVEQRWFPTLLHPSVVSKLIGQIDIGDLTVEARLAPDPQLGAVAVCLEARGETAHGRVDAVALDIVTGCLIEELLADLAVSSH